MGGRTVRGTGAKGVVSTTASTKLMQTARSERGCFFFLSALVPPGAYRAHYFKGSSAHRCCSALQQQEFSWFSCSSPAACPANVKPRNTDSNNTTEYSTFVCVTFCCTAVSLPKKWRTKPLGVQISRSPTYCSKMYETAMSMHGTVHDYRMHSQYLTPTHRVVP